MARRLRIHIPDGWYHVMSRGNGGEALYRADTDRRRFLGLVAELPERFGTEVHAFVLMDNHYHLLLRCRGTDVSETLRWLQTAYAIRFNWAHRRRGHVFQGRFKSVLIREEAALDAVARYLHLNPVRIGGLGLSKEDQRQAKVVGCADPGATLIARRLDVLRDYPWSSWRVYAGGEAAPKWLTLDRIASGCGGRRRQEQRAALITYTEQPIRQGRLDSPWEGWVAGAVLGDADETVSLLRARLENPDRQTEAMRQAAGRGRPGWSAIVQAAEALLGGKWGELMERHGDWGRDGTMAVAVRYLGWRMAEVVRQVPGVNYAAVAQGIRRFWRRAETEPARAQFTRRLRAKMSNVNV
jgi:REP element-mobilizing transposase RayT